jgi:hypothetical protein
MRAREFSSVMSDSYFLRVAITSAVMRSAREEHEAA